MWVMVKEVSVLAENSVSVSYAALASLVITLMLVANLHVNNIHILAEVVK